MKLSFGTKIFLASCLTVLGVVGFTTVKNSLYLRDLLSLIYQNHMIDATELSATKIQTTLNRWDTKLSYFTQALLQSPSDTHPKILKSLLESEKNISFFGLYQLGPEEKFISTYPEKAAYKLSMKDLEILKKREIAIQTHRSAPDTVLLMRKIKVQKPFPSNYAAVIGFKTQALQIRPDDQDLNSYLLDDQFKDLYKSQNYQQILAQDGFYNKARKIMREDVGSGYLGQIDLKAKKYFVAYSKLDYFPLYLVVHHNNGMIQKAVLALLREMVQWAIVFVLLTILASSFLIKGLLKNLGYLHRATVYVAQGHFDHNLKINSQDEIGQLGHSFNVMTRKIKDLLGSEREKVRFEQELSVANTVQNTFFTTETLDTEKIKIAGYYKPASECGGDWWGHIPISDTQHLVFIGDATGHGVSSALITALAYATAHVISENLKKSGEKFSDPAQINSHLNRLLYSTLKGRLCMSFITMVMDTETQQVIFSNGGHPHPLLITADPSDPRLGAKAKLPIKALMQKKPCTGILGIAPEAEFFNESINLSPGDRIFVYSDGLVECKNLEGKQWGSHGLRKSLGLYHKQPLQEMQEGVVRESINNNAQGQSFADDVSLVIVQMGESLSYAA